MPLTTIEELKKHTHKAMYRSVDSVCCKECLERATMISDILKFVDEVSSSVLKYQ